MEHNSLGECVSEKCFQTAEIYVKYVCQHQENRPYMSYTVSMNATLLWSGSSSVQHRHVHMMQQTTLYNTHLPWNWSRKPPEPIVSAPLPIPREFTTFQNKIV